MGPRSRGGVLGAAPAHHHHHHPNKNNIDRVCVKASRAEGRPATPSHKHGLCPPLGSQPAFLLNIAGQCSAERPAETPKVGA